MPSAGNDDGAHVKVAFLLKFDKLLVKFHPSDAQSIAVTRQA